jgi:hypothetical protein
MKMYNVSGSTLPSEEKVPLPEDFCRNRAPCLWLVKHSISRTMYPSYKSWCPVGLRVFSLGVANHMISPASFLSQDGKLLRRVWEQLLAMGVCCQVGMRALSSDPEHHMISPSSFLLCGGKLQGKAWKYGDQPLGPGSGCMDLLPGGNESSRTHRSHRVVICRVDLKALSPTGRVPECLTSPPPVQNLVSCLLPHNSDALKGCPRRGYLLTRPGDTNWGAYGTSGALPSTQVSSSLWPAAASGTQRKEVSKVKAAQKWTTNPRPAPPSADI